MKERITCNTITSGRPVDLVLEGLHGSSRFCLGLLAFTCKLDVVEYNEAMANASCFTEAIESVLKLPKLKLLLAVDDTSVSWTW